MELEFKSWTISRKLSPQALTFVLCGLLGPEPLKRDVESESDPFRQRFCIAAAVLFERDQQAYFTIFKELYRLPGWRRPSRSAVRRALRILRQVAAEVQTTMPGVGSAASPSSIAQRRRAS